MSCSSISHSTTLGTCARDTSKKMRRQLEARLRLRLRPLNLTDRDAPSFGSGMLRSLVSSLMYCVIVPTTQLPAASNNSHCCQESLPANQRKPASPETDSSNGTRTCKVCVQAHMGTCSPLVWWLLRLGTLNPPFCSLYCTPCVQPVNVTLEYTAHHQVSSPSCGENHLT